MHRLQGLKVVELRALARATGLVIQALLGHQGGGLEEAFAAVPVANPLPPVKIRAVIMAESTFGFGVQLSSAS